MNHRITSCLFLFLLLPLHGQVAGQTDWDAVEIQVTPLRGGVHMVVAAGGNQAVFVGPEELAHASGDESMERTPSGISWAIDAGHGCLLSGRENLREGTRHAMGYDTLTSRG